MAAMPPYPVYCSWSGCHELAVYKIAAAWSDGVTAELKTYALVCPTCLAAAYAASKTRQAACRLAASEKLEVPGIYLLARGERDQKLQRCPELEQQLNNPPT